MLNSDSSPLIAVPPSRRRTLWPIWVVAALLVIVPFWSWYSTWFGRKLSDAEITQYLSGSEKPRKMQHALLQIEQRIIARDANVKQWYPQIAALKNNALPEIRVTAAWVMGQDNTSDSFHQALLEMLADSQPLVRRNAALGLVRFADARGHAELLAMLKPYTIQAPRAGTVTTQLKEEQSIAPDILVARIKLNGAEVLEVRSPLPGKISAIKVEKEAKVNAGDDLIVLSPDQKHILESLRALSLIGLPDDLPEVERYARGVEGMSDNIKRQAALTAEAIRKRQ